MKPIGVTIILDDDLCFEEWEEELEYAGFEYIGNCIIEERYYYDKSIENFTENEIENYCLRISRNSNGFIIQNNELLKQRVRSINFSNEEKKILMRDSIAFDESDHYERCLQKLNFKRIITSKEEHYYYKNEQDNVIIELQQVEKIGLLLYYDNPKYFHMSVEEQMKQLIEDLIYDYGFDIPDDCEIFDKLRYIYHRKL